MRFISFFFFILTVNTYGQSNDFDPNNMRNTLGKVYLKNGQIEAGEISIKNAKDVGKNYQLIILRKINKVNERILFGDIDQISIQNDFFTLMSLSSDNLLASKERRLFFVKRMTETNSKIHLFQFMETDKFQQRTKTRYLLNFPGMDTYDTYDVEHSRITPNFDEKVSALVKDCPVLAEKIKSKKNGYFYAKVSFIENRVRDVWLTIINEFNACN